jgi:uncharacterized protein (TIGR02186 family)
MEACVRHWAYALGTSLALGFAGLPAMPSQTHAETANAIEAGASQNYFYIEPSYDGTAIILFGSIDRESLHGRPFDLAVTIEGPIRPVTVWKKGRIAGLWVNTESLTFEGVPNYYAVLSTRPVQEIAPLEVRKTREIGLDALTLPLKAPNAPNDHSPAPQEFQDALIRLKKSTGLFSENNKGAFEFFGSRLFRSRVFLPASAGPGLYRVKFFVLQDGKPAGDTSARIRLKKIGIEARLSSAAINYPWLYGLMAVTVAALAGGGASLVFRRS